jgi:hypothetical protein
MTLASNGCGDLLEHMTFPAPLGFAEDVPAGRVRGTKTLLESTGKGLLEVTTDTKPLGRVYYEEVEAMKSEGTSNADAIRTVAEKHGKKENAIRGSLHQYKTRHLNGNGASAPGRSRRAPLGVEDHLANARQSLQTALEVIDQEVAAAKAALDTAQAHYDEITTSVSERKADIEQKLKVLS